jgi:hypothetical protein
LGTRLKNFQPLMERFRQKQIKLEELTQQWWGGPANFIHQSDHIHGTS